MEYPKLIKRASRVQLALNVDLAERGFEWKIIKDITLILEVEFIANG